MSAEEIKAACVRAPNDFPSIAAGTADYGSRKFSTSNASAANAIPASWSGRWIAIHNNGTTDVHYAFSQRSTAAVNMALASSAAGASADVGEVILAGTKEHVELPIWDVNETCFFVRQSVLGTPDVILSLKDGREH